MGGTSKSHAMYVRYWNLCKKPPTAKAGLPDLEELIAQAKKDGSIHDKGGASGGKRGSGAGNKRGRQTVKAAEEDDDDQEINGSAKKAKVSKTDEDDGLDLEV